MNFKHMSRLEKLVTKKNFTSIFTGQVASFKFSSVAVSLGQSIT